MQCAMHADEVIFACIRKMVAITVKTLAFAVAYQLRCRNLSSLRICPLVVGEIDGTQQVDQVLNPGTLVPDRTDNFDFGFQTRQVAGLFFVRE